MVLENSFFELQREKQHVYLDVPQTGKVADLIKDLKDLLELDHDVTILQKADENDVWVPLDAEKKLADYGWTKEKALAHQPIQLAFTYPQDEGVNMTAMTVPEPVPVSEFQ